MSIDKKTEYLGDSVYIETDGYHIILYVDNGLGSANKIFLEPDMIDGIVEYKKRNIENPDYPSE